MRKRVVREITLDEQMELFRTRSLEGGCAYRCLEPKQVKVRDGFWTKIG